MASGDDAIPRIRPATEVDQAEISRIVRSSNINPFGLRWPRFLVAEERGRIIGTGQVKQHGDGSRELASIAVIPEYRGRGIATAVVNALLARESDVLYLTCRRQMEPFYNRFGFVAVGRDEMSPYFRRIAWATNPPRFLVRLFGWGEEGGLIMKRAMKRAASSAATSPSPDAL
jgi:N-acetylglutamate synthase-like GNAT family acetyltransferase